MRRLGRLAEQLPVRPGGPVRRRAAVAAAVLVAAGAVVALRAATEPIPPRPAAEPSRQAAAEPDGWAAPAPAAVRPAARPHTHSGADCGRRG